VAGGRIYFRQFYDPLAHPRLNEVGISLIMTTTATS
jgi:hypothetical protein